MELLKRIDQIINSLSDFDQTLLKLRFGFNNDEPLKIVEIAKMYGVTKSYISKKIIDLLYIIGRDLQNEGYIAGKIRINRRKKINSLAIYN